MMCTRATSPYDVYGVYEELLNVRLPACISVICQKLHLSFEFRVFVGIAVRSVPVLILPIKVRIRWRDPDAFAGKRTFSRGHPHCVHTSANEFCCLTLFILHSMFNGKVYVMHRYRSPYSLMRCVPREAAVFSTISGDAQPRVPRLLARDHFRSLSPGVSSITIPLHGTPENQIINHLFSQCELQTTKSTPHPQHAIPAS